VQEEESSYLWLEEILWGLRGGGDVSELMARVLCPKPGRLTVPDSDRKRVLEAHETAMRRGEKTYVDPLSSFHVFTAVAHLERGTCCSNGCRHCPYEEEVSP